MSDFKFPCPKCGQSILCDTSNAGMQIPCPACSTLLTVPPPPPAVPASGPVKLGINKSAHHAPPPSTANAPAKPAWGTKPAPLSVKKKKFPVAMVSTIGVIIIVLAVGWFAFGAPYLKQRAEQEKQKQEEADRQAKADAEAAAAAAAKLKASKAGWKLDLANTDFPDRRASGKIHTVDFNVETVIFQGGVLILRQDSGSSRQFLISVPFKTGETTPGKSFTVSSTDPASQPRIIMSYKDDSGKPPTIETFTKGYGMKLEFGAAADGKVPGKIYLSVPDPEQSFVAGHFEIGPRTAAGSSTPASPEPVRILKGQRP